MRWLLAAAVLVAACGAPQRAPEPRAAEDRPAPADAAPAETTVVLELDKTVDVPGTGVVATLRRVTPEEPRAEDPMTGAFAEREPATAYVELRSGGAVEMVRWGPGEHEFGGDLWTLAIRSDRVALTWHGRAPAPAP